MAQTVKELAEQVYELVCSHSSPTQFVPWNNLHEDEQRNWLEALSKFPRLLKKSVGSQISATALKIAEDMRLGNTYNAGYLHKILNELVESARQECQQFYEAQARKYGMGGIAWVTPPEHGQYREALRRKDEEIYGLEKKIETVRSKVHEAMHAKIFYMDSNWILDMLK